MSSDVEIDTKNQTVTGIRTLRNSGNSMVLTIPPEAVNFLDLAEDEDLKIEADWEKRRIQVSPAEEDLE